MLCNSPFLSTEEEDGLIRFGGMLTYKVMDFVLY